MICPNCGSWVDEGEPICSSCGASFGDDYEEEYTCPECHRMFMVDEFDTKCPFCGAPIEKKNYF